MKNSSFLKYLIIVSFGVMLVDVVVRLVFTPVFNNLPEGTKAAETYKFMTMNDPVNIVVLGASAANHHYVSTQIEDSLHMTCYNYGWDGRSILYQYLSLIKAIENGDVKIAVLDMGKSLLCYKWTEDRISDLYPYYWENDTIKNMVDEIKGQHMALLMCSAMLQFNSQYFNLLAHINDIKGYTPLPYKGKPVIVKKRKHKKSRTSQVEDVHPVALKYFGRLVDLCNKKNIRLVICLSPRLRDMTDNNRYIKQLCNDYGLECWDMSEFIQDPILFSDETHLNDKGATLYTNEVIKILRDI